MQKSNGLARGLSDLSVHWFEHFLLMLKDDVSFVDPFGYLCFVSIMLSCLSIQPCSHLLGKGWPLGSLVCDVFLCYSHFPMRCPGSSLVIDCIDS